MTNGHCAVYMAATGVFGIRACGAAGIHGTRTGKNLIVYCVSAKDYPADPADLYPAAFLC